jgi:hypothetical protein
VHGFLLELCGFLFLFNLFFFNPFSFLSFFYFFVVSWIIFKIKVFLRFWVSFWIVGLFFW